MDVSLFDVLDPKATRHDARVIERALAEQAQQLGAPRGKGARFQPVATLVMPDSGPHYRSEYFMDSVDEVATNFQYMVAATDVAAFVLLRRDLSLKERAIDEVVLEATDPESLLVDAKQLAQDQVCQKTLVQALSADNIGSREWKFEFKDLFGGEKKVFADGHNPGRVKLSWAAADAIGLAAELDGKSFLNPNAVEACILNGLTGPRSLFCSTSLSGLDTVEQPDFSAYRINDLIEAPYLQPALPMMDLVLQPLSLAEEKALAERNVRGRELETVSR